MTPPTRREMLRAAGTTAAGVGAASLVGCSSGEDIKAGPTSVKAAEVPVGGAKIIDNTNYVVSQPTAGDYRAFTRLCKHAGCNVTSVSGKEVICPCHGSRFSIEDGSVTQGPATDGLSKAKATLQGDTVQVTP